MIGKKMDITIATTMPFTMLFDFAAFDNKGDPAIIVGELATIRKLELAGLHCCATFKTNKAKNMKLAFAILELRHENMHMYKL